MGTKLNVFKDPFMDRATETEDLMAKIRALNGGEDPADERLTGSAGSFGAKRTAADGGTDYSSPLGKGRGSAGRLGAADRLGSDYSSSSFGGPDGKRRGGRLDHLSDLTNLSEDMKARAARLNDAKRRKDELEAKRLRRDGLDELRTGLKHACNEYDRMADDLEQQIEDIDAINQRVNQAIDDRGVALDEQIG